MLILIALRFYSNNLFMGKITGVYHANSVEAREGRRDNEMERRGSRTTGYSEAV